LTPTPIPTNTPTVTPTPKTKIVVIYRSGRPIIPHVPVNTGTGLPEAIAGAAGAIGTAVGSFFLKRRIF